MVTIKYGGQYEKCSYTGHDFFGSVHCGVMTKSSQFVKARFKRVRFFPVSPPPRKIIRAITAIRARGLGLTLMLTLALTLTLIALIAIIALTIIFGGGGPTGKNQELN